MAEPKPPVVHEDLYKGLSLLGPHLGEVMRTLDAMTTNVATLNAAVAKKANTDDVPTLAQFQALTRDVPTLDCVPTVDMHMSLSKALEDFRHQLERAAVDQATQLELKANISDVPSVQMLQAVGQELERKMAEELARLAKLSELKADASDVPTLEMISVLGKELDSALERKADLATSPSWEQLEALSTSVKSEIEGFADEHKARHEELMIKIGNKADSASVPTLDDFGVLSQTVSGKAERHMVPTLEHVGGIQRELSKKAEHHGVPTSEQFEAAVKHLKAVSDAVDAKADASSTKQEHAQLFAMIEKLAIADLPSLEQFEDSSRQLGVLGDRHCETMQTVRALADRLDAKAESTWVEQQCEALHAIISNAECRDASARETSNELMAQVKALADALQLKAPISSTQEQFESMNLKVLKAEQTVMSAIEQSHIPVSKELKELSDGVVATRKYVLPLHEFETWRVLMESRVLDSELGFQRLTKSVGDKADIDWAQEQLRGITDILLPVARAVRGLRTTPGSGPVLESADSQVEPVAC